MVTVNKPKATKNPSRAKAKKLGNRLAVDLALRVQLRYNPVEQITEEQFAKRFR